MIDTKSVNQIKLIFNIINNQNRFIVMSKIAKTERLFVKEVKKYIEGDNVNEFIDYPPILRNIDILNKE